MCWWWQVCVPPHRLSRAEGVSAPCWGQLPPLLPAHLVPRPQGCPPCRSTRRGHPGACSSPSLIGIPSPRGGSWLDGSGVTAVTGNASRGDDGSRRVGSKGTSPPASPRWDTLRGDGESPWGLDAAGPCALQWDAPMLTPGCRGCSERGVGVQLLQQHAVPPVDPVATSSRPRQPSNGKLCTGKKKPSREVLGPRARPRGRQGEGWRLGRAGCAGN